jgi:regulator of sirC expression with transglutaminase-like and TPR domain
VDIKGANGKAEDLLQEFLGRENARLFLHELENWLRSPFQEIEEWDRRVQYMFDVPLDGSAVERAGEKVGLGRRADRYRPNG